MQPIVEALERRRLLSNSLPLGSELIWIQEPTDVTARHGMRPAVSVELEDSFGQLLVRSHLQVKLSVVSGPQAGRIVGTATLARGKAVFGRLVFKNVGTYVLQAAARGASPTLSGVFAVSPTFKASSGTRMVLTQATNPLAGEEDFQIELLDKDGNLATGDTSTLSFSLGPHSGINAIGFPLGLPNEIVVNGVVVGVKFVNGVANFSIVSFGSGGGSVVFFDSNPLVSPLASPIWAAHA
jgi:hypothetical protein